MITQYRYDEMRECEDIQPIRIRNRPAKADGYCTTVHSRILQPDSVPYQPPSSMPASQRITAKPVATASCYVLTYATYYPCVYPIQHTLPVSFIIPIREKIRDRKYKHAFQRTPYILRSRY